MSGRSNGSFVGVVCEMKVLVGGSGDAVASSDTDDEEKQRRWGRSDAQKPPRWHNLPGVLLPRRTAPILCLLLPVRALSAATCTDPERLTNRNAASPRIEQAAGEECRPRSEVLRAEDEDDDRATSTTAACTSAVDDLEARTTSDGMAQASMLLVRLRRRSDRCASRYYKY